MVLILLGWIVSLYTLIVSIYNTVMYLLGLLPTCFSWFYDFCDFITDCINVYMAELHSPLPILAFMFAMAITIKIIIEVI